MHAPSENPMPPAGAGWRVADEEFRSGHPDAPWSWLSETGSLTGRLKSVCRGRFALRVLQESGVTLDAAMAGMLESAEGEPALCREVHLTCAGVPCIHALSLIPSRTLQDGGAYLAGLGERPLGDALFSDPGLERGDIEVLHLEPGEPLHERVAPAHAGPVWGRRSVFRTGGRPLLVTEFFLPGLARCGG